MVATTLSLPLAPPLVQSYLFLAYPLAILAGHGQVAMRWVLSTFVQLYCQPNGSVMFYAHPWSPAHELRRVALSCCPFLDVQQLDQRLVGTPLVPFLQRCIENGLYAQVDIDYSCLPWEQRQPWLHEILLCGVDRHARVFEALAYTPGGGFHAFRIDADTIETAAAAAAKITRGTPQARERPRLLLYRFVDDTTHNSQRHMDVAGVCDHLWDYLEAADSSHRHRAVAPAIDAVWGVDTCSCLERDVLASGATSTTLSTPLRVWWEHKRLMALRFAQLEQDGLLDPALGSSTQAGHVAGLAWQARLMALRWRGDTTGTRVITLLRETAARELDIAGAVVNALAGTHRQAA